MSTAKSLKFLISLFLLAFMGLKATANTNDNFNTEGQWRMCPPAAQIAKKPEYSSKNTSSDNYEIRAETSLINEKGLSQFGGEVEVIQGRRAIAAELVNYDKIQKTFSAEGRAHLWDANVLWAGERATYDTKKEVSMLEGGKFWTLSGRGRGSSTQIRNSRLEQRTKLLNASYSTCPESNEIWRLDATSITLNHKTDRGHATNALLSVLNVPIFYIPYISFPISDERKSGFLTPTIGNSNESGFDAQIPYYINLASNRDITITPRILSNRGALISSEIRYLNSSFNGEFMGSFIADDDLRNGDSRSFLKIKHQQWAFQNKAYLNINYNNVSDDDYFSDFGNDMSSTSQRYLRQFIDFRYQDTRQSLSIFARKYQLLGSVPSQFEPYKTLPRIDHTFSVFNLSSETGNVFRLKTYTHFTNYEKDNSLTGKRVIFQPTVSVNLQKPYGNIFTEMRVRHNHYFLDDPANEFDKTESFTVPTFSIDGRLFLEREAKIFDNAFLQSLEPRLFYLLIPNVQQDLTPNFGTAQFSSNFKSIFRKNRFGGLDRVGDANQLTFSLTNRYLDALNGSEKFRISIGQVFHFRDRKVLAVDGQKNTDDLSELLFESSLFFNDDLSIRGTFKYDPNEGHISKSNFSLRYQPDLDSVINFNFRQRKAFNSRQADLEQLDLSARLPLKENIALIGKWNYSIEQSNSVETFGGIEYESCCWGAKLVARRFLKDASGAHDNSIFMQIHFRGLGGFGRGGSESFIQTGIPGYVDPFE